MAGLGRGLGSLLGEQKKIQEERKKESVVQTTAPVEEQAQVAEPKVEIIAPENSVVELPTAQLRASIYQPRQNFDEDSLKELSLSIQEHGLLEPLLVKKAEDGFYEIICGERRYRACKLASLEKIPCLIRDDLEVNSYAVALIENIQREDLNPVELAKAFALMIDECNLSQEELAKTLGKSRSSVTNILRINNLQEDVKNMVAAGQLDLGHAKVLLALEDGEVQLKAALYVIKKSLSIRQTEALVKDIKENGTDSFEKKEKVSYNNENFNNWEKDLSSKLSGVKVKFKAVSDDKGKVTLSYSSKEELEEILKCFSLES